MAETIALNVNVNTGEAVSSLGQLEKATKKVTQTTKTAAKESQTLEQQFDALNKEIKESPVNIRAMNKQIQAYQGIALEAGRTSPLGKEAIRKAAEIKDRYIDIQNEVNRLANDGVKLKAALDIGSTLVAGFAGFQGVMALIGSDNEDLRKSMVKLQGAMSLLMAVETLRKNLEKESTVVLVYKNTVEKASVMWTKAMTLAQLGYNLVMGKGTKAMKIFRIALASTGIGLIIVGIGLLIANFDKVTAAVKWFGNMVYKFFKPQIDLVITALQWLGIVATDEAKAQEAAAQKTIKASEDRRKEIDKLLKKNTEANEKIISDLDFEIRKRKALGLSTTEIELKKLETLIFIAKEEKKLQSENIKRMFEEVKARMALGTITQEQRDEINEHYKEVIQARKETTKTIKKAEEDLAIFKIDLKKKEKEDLEKAAADRKKIYKKTVTDNKKAEDIITKNLEKEEVKRLALLEKARIKKAKLLADEQKREDEQFELFQELTNTAYEQELHLLAKQYEKKYALALGNAELTKALKEQSDLDIAALNKKFDDEAAVIKAEKDEADDAADDAKDEKKAADRQQDLDDMSAKLDNASAFLGSLQTLNNLASGKSEAQQKKAFERTKKIQAAEAMIAAAKGIVNILGQTSVIPEPFATVYKGVQIAILAITLAAQLKKIKSAKFGGGGSTIQTPSLGGGGGTSAPTLSPISNTNTLIGQDNKVYVTETDISNTQNKVAVIEERATF